MFLLWQQEAPTVALSCRGVDCYKCQKKGHFAKVCRSITCSAVEVSESFKTSDVQRAPHATLVMMNQPQIASVIDNMPSSLSKSSGVVRVWGHKVHILFDSCSSESFIHPHLVNSLKLKVRPTFKTISMVASAFSTEVKGHTCVNITYQGQDYTGVRLGVLDHLCCDILLGIDFQAQHSSVVFKFGGNKTTLTVCGSTTLRTKSPKPFKNLTADCHPVAVRYRKYSQEDRAFINEEVRRLLKEGIIEPSSSPWRAQVVVVKGKNHKRRMAIDYSQILIDLLYWMHSRYQISMNWSTKYLNSAFSVQLTWKALTIKYLCKKRINLTRHLRQVQDYTNSPTCHLVSLMALPVSSV